MADKGGAMTADSTHQEVRRQKDMLQSLRRENKDLRASLAQASRSIAGASGAAGAGGSAAYQRREAEGIQSKLFGLRRQLDSLRAENDMKAKEIGKQQEKLDELRCESKPILSDQSPVAQKIRILENDLDKALIKHNEAVAIRRTYEQIVKRLQEERVGFDNQLAAIERTLKAKEHDTAELENMAHDAHHAREVARAQVAQFKASYAEERRAKKKELEDRKQYVQKQMERALKQEQAAKQRQQREDAQQGQQREDEERRRKDVTQSATELRTEEEEERLRQLADSYRRIREVTRAANVDGVIAKFIAQEDTHRGLTEATQEVQGKIDRLQAQRAELKRKLDDAKFSGAGLLGSRRILDEFETHLAEARAQLAKSTKNYERVAHVQIGVKAGVEHLVQKLSTYRTEMVGPTPVGDDNLVDALKHCEQKLLMLLDEAPADLDQAARLMDVAEVVLPQHNVRTKLARRGADDEDDGVDPRREAQRGDRADAEDADDDPHTRESLKAMTQSTVDRETKKARKRGRKKEDEM